MLKKNVLKVHSCEVSKKAISILWRQRVSFSRFRASCPNHWLSFSASVKPHCPELVRLRAIPGTMNKDSVSPLSGKGMCGDAVSVCFPLLYMNTTTPIFKE